LFDWAERNRARALVAAGRFADAENVFRAIAARTETPADLDFEAARDFHLAGALPQAVAWYRQGTGRGAASGVGRLKWEFVEGIVLALGEMGRWAEADEEISRIAAAYANSFGHADWYHRYVEWRTTGTPSNAALVAPGHDLHHYWALEFALARGADPAALLGKLDVEAARASGSKALFASLRAELLARLGRHAEALAAARAAYAAAGQERLTDTATRAHFGLMASRFAAIARQNGSRAEAAAALAEAERFRWHPAAPATIAASSHALPRSALQ
jgi:tetratricopeptide (TPR) repeat protein